jgi:UDP-N-acetylmuramate--alanine ligase
MNIFFSGIGGTAIGPFIAKEAGHTVSGSDKQPSQYIDYLTQHGIDSIYIGQTYEAIAALHRKTPIDWYVYSSSIAIENPDAPEFNFCRQQQIKMSKRDELLNQIMHDKSLKLIAVAGTHGKTTTTAMVIWLYHKLDVPLSYSVGAKFSFGDMGRYDPKSQYFAYEADEFDRNFLAFEPTLSLITGVSWDHHEIFPSREDYQAAFREFISQSKQTIIWREDAAYLDLDDVPGVTQEDSASPAIASLDLLGQYNRLDGWLAIQAVHLTTNAPLDTLTELIGQFPGLQRRMEQLIPNLYTDYAHTPEKIRGAMSVALEKAAINNQPLIVIYEPLTNRRQHYMLDDYGDCFTGAAKVYWTPSYLAREDPTQRIIHPDELISRLADPHIAEPAALNRQLKENIQKHLDEGVLVIGMAGGGGNSLDEWLRKEFVQ